MRFWIDGYNLLCHLRLQKQHALEQARARIAGLVSGRAQRLYFDARSGGGKEQRAGLSIIFTAGESADDRIVADLRAEGGSGIGVVTNDRELSNRCTQLGATTLSCDAFLNPPPQRGGGRSAPARDPDRPTGVRTTAELDDWLRAFGEPPTQP